MPFLLQVLPYPSFTASLVHQHGFPSPALTQKSCAAWWCLISLLSVCLSDYGLS